MKSYDVIIIGAGVAGLECAKNLANSGLTILIIERNKQISRKICAEGIVPGDLHYIPKEFLNFDFQKATVFYKDKKIVFPDDGGVISSINREKLLGYQIGNLKKFANITFSFGSAVSAVVSGNLLKLNSGETVHFKFLVGADGSNSAIRRFLGLPIKKTGMAIQYIIPRKFDNFEIYLDDHLFGTGYAWIFPNKDYTSVGCGSDLRFIKPALLKSNFDIWLKDNKIDVVDAKFEGALINYDYRGYKFGNIFLAGDAAGVTSGLLGKGINSAFLSGEQVARDILNIQGENLIKKWVAIKRSQERLMIFLRSKFLRKIFFSLAMRMLSYKKARNILSKIINE
jgi:geranylgeranyl reductase